MKEILLLENITGKKVVLIEDAKDVQRVEDIKTKSNGRMYDARKLAELMADKITTPDKAYNRYLAAQQVFPNDNSVANVFLDRAKRLGHVDGVKAADDRDAAQRAKWEQERKEAYAKAMVPAQAFIKQMSKRYPDLVLSTTSSNPVQYQSGDGKTVYVEIGGDIDRLTKGLAGLGDQRKANYRTHSAIRNLASRLGGHNEFNYSKPFASFRV
jgi:hypothetical protein